MSWLKQERYLGSTCTSLPQVPPGGVKAIFPDVFKTNGGGLFTKNAKNENFEEARAVGRPAKSAKVSSGKVGKDAKDTRNEVENKLRGEAVKPEAPEYLTDDQKKVFRFIVDNLADGDILGKLDVFVLESTAVAVDRLRSINEMVNKDQDLMFSTSLMGARSKFQSDLWRGCNELCLSPQARAKIGSLSAAAAGGKDKKDPLMAALEEDD